MAEPISPLSTKRHIGNPNWGKRSLQPLPPALPTQFELQVERLGLTRDEYVKSRELKNWCEQNRNRYYIPEWLLEAWKVEVRVGFDWMAEEQPTPSLPE